MSQVIFLRNSLICVCVRNASVIHGVVLGNFSKEITAGIYVLSSSGEVFEALVPDVMFAILDFSAEDVVLRAGTDEIATSEQQINARVAILKQIKELENLQG